MKIKEKSENLISRPLFYPWRDIFSARTQVFVGEKLVKFRKEIPFSALWQNQGKNGISAKNRETKNKPWITQIKKNSHFVTRHSSIRHLSCPGASRWFRHQRWMNRKRRRKRRQKRRRKRRRIGAGIDAGNGAGNKALTTPERRRRHVRVEILGQRQSRADRR